MDYREQIFKMLDIEPDEEFKLNNGLRYCLDKDLNLWYRNPEWFEGRFEAADYSIKDILNGAYKIIKLPKEIKPTKEEQIAIDYARLCGYGYLAKDKDDRVYAYDKKPHKIIEKGEWKNGFNCLRIHFPISLLSWEDTEPYYIGGDENA